MSTWWGAAAGGLVAVTSDLVSLFRAKQENSARRDPPENQASP